MSDKKAVKVVPQGTSPFLVDEEYSKAHEKAKLRQDGKTRTVFLYAHVMSVSEIDTVQEAFSAYCYVKATWVEEDLSAADVADGPPETCWQPRLMFMNAIATLDIEDEKLELSPWRKSRDGKGVVLEWSAKVRGSFREKFELHTFPFDMQPLCITISTQMKNVLFLEDKFDGVQSKIREEFLVLPDFAVDNLLLFVDKEAALGKFAIVDVRMLVRRRWAYHFWHLFLPIFLLTAMTFASFVIPVGDVADRLSVTLTLVLASVAFKYVVAQELPRISYLTLCDVYVFANFVFVVLVVAENCVAGLLAADDEEFGMQFDRYAISAFLIGYCMLTVLFIFCASMAARAAAGREQVALFSKQTKRGL